MEQPEHQPRFLRRPAAAEYLRANWGFGSKFQLAKFAVYGGGPRFRKVSNCALYTPDDLDAWARAKIGEPAHTTSEHQVLRAAGNAA
jgi:hypothetical protein